MPRSKRTAAQRLNYEESEKRRQGVKWECHCEVPECGGGLVSQSLWRKHRAYTEARAQERKDREGVDDLLAGYPPFHDLDHGVDMAINSDDSEPEHERKEAVPTDSDDEFFDGLGLPPADGQRLLDFSSLVLAPLSSPGASATCTGAGAGAAADWHARTSTSYVS